MAEETRREALKRICADHLRSALISMGVGAGLVFLITSEEGLRAGPTVYGALTGLLAYAFCTGLSFLFRGWLRRPGVN
jgi:hypothetical protein